MAYEGGFPRASQVLQIARGQYDFATDGGAVGDIDLTSQSLIPDNAVIVGGLVSVLTAVTGGGSATLAVKVEGAGDMVAAADVTGSPWSTTGFKDVIPDGTGSTAVQTTAARKITATVATADLTAGKFDVVVFYTVLA
jgi:hypothetical protein